MQNRKRYSENCKNDREIIPFVVRANSKGPKTVPIRRTRKTGKGIKEDMSFVKSKLHNCLFNLRKV